MWLEKIRFEIGELDQEIIAFQPLIQSVRIKPPDLTEKAAVAAFLHSFYNGIERLLILYCRYLQLKVPEGSHSHSQLLELLTTCPENHPLLSVELVNHLKESWHFAMYFVMPVLFSLIGRKWNFF